MKPLFVEYLFVRSCLKIVKFINFQLDRSIIFFYLFWRNVFMCHTKTFNERIKKIHWSEEKLIWKLDKNVIERDI